MKKKLKILFEKSIELGDEKYTNEQINSKWIGKNPASKIEIRQVEERLGINFPQDYVELLTITNGFLTCSRDVEPSFQAIEEVDFYRNFQWNVIDIWTEMENDIDLITKLKRSIMIAGSEDSQQFLIIPPIDENDQWRYWKFATWSPEEDEYKNLEEYLDEVIDFIEQEID